MPRETRYSLAFSQAVPADLVPVALAVVLVLWTAAGLALHHLAQRALGELR